MRVRVAALLMPLVLVGCSGPAAPPSASTAKSPSPSPSTSSTASPSTSSSASASLDPNAGKERTDEHGVAQVWVPAGSFLIGTDESDPTGELAPPTWARFELASERPQHEVALSAGYWIDKTEVTNEAFQAFVAGAS